MQDSHLTLCVISASYVLDKIPQFMPSQEFYKHCIKAALYLPKSGDNLSIPFHLLQVLHPFFLLIYQMFQIKFHTWHDFFLPNVFLLCLCVSCIQTSKLPQLIDWKMSVLSFSLRFIFCYWLWFVPLSNQCSYTMNEEILGEKFDFPFRVGFPI